MAILKLRRDAPAECADADPSEGFVELRVPLPRELGRGADDFSRMLLGLPPGGPYEAYLLYDHSMLTGSADVWLDAEARRRREAGGGCGDFRGGDFRGDGVGSDLD